MKSGDSKQETGHKEEKIERLEALSHTHTHTHHMEECKTASQCAGNDSSWIVTHIFRNLCHGAPVSAAYRGAAFFFLSPS